jgi:hypothetical protein
MNRPARGKRRKNPKFRYLQQLFALFFIALKYFCRGQK